jgi:hypothetical protein
MSSDTKTPATAGVGDPKPKIFDEQGAIGKHFTGMELYRSLSFMLSKPSNEILQSKVRSVVQHRASAVRLTKRELSESSSLLPEVWVVASRMP